MSQRLLLIFFVALAILAANLWHAFASYFVHSYGIMPGLILLAALIWLAVELDPYC